ncbi:MAG: hypothetical protein ACYCOU_17660 [Sulfobacillus sp.]
MSATRNLSSAMKKYVDLYTSFGDRVPNSLLRGEPSEWATEYLSANSTVFVDFFLQIHLVTLRDFLLEFLHELQAMI